MTNKQAYYALLDTRPTIIAVLERDANKFQSPEALAKSITGRGDSPDLIELISKSAAYIKKVMIKK
jgi:hypothetical protein